MKIFVPIIAIAVCLICFLEVGTIPLQKQLPKNMSYKNLTNTFAKYSSFENLHFV